MSSRIEGQPIPVKLGEPFSILPNLNKHLKRFWGGDVLVPSVKLRIEGGKTGRVEVRKARDYLDWNEGACLPAGNFTVKFETGPRGVLRPTVNTSPLEICLFINDLTTDEAARFRAEMIIGEKRFKGQWEHDELEVQQRGDADMMFLSWREAGRRGRVVLSFFPNDPDLFNRVKFVIHRTEQTARKR